MLYDRRTSRIAPLPRTARILETAVPARAVWRWAALTLAAASALVGARQAAGQNVKHPTGRKNAHPTRVSAVLPPPTPSAVTPRTLAVDSTRVFAADLVPAATPRLAADTAASDLATPPVPGAVPVVLPPAPPASLPAAPNVPGAPNYAGRLAVSLARADVVAPLVTTVSGGSGPEVMHVQVLLDAARFSPGAVSGVWNENTVFAIRAFRAVAHLPPGDSADADVVARLERTVGARVPLTDYIVTSADVRGPYRRTPGSMYAKAKADCLCYQSMVEMFGERFHTTPDALRRLNPDVDLGHARAGTRLVVPNVGRGAAPPVTRLLVDKREGSIRGLDARGVTRFWLPATVGSPSLPSPRGRLRVVSATLNPRYQYDPVVLGEERGARPNAILPAGPNSPVGVLWAQLSRPHVGLHGTPDPEDVGYTMSHGCVRMANWDARWLTPLLQPGLIVDFQ